VAGQWSGSADTSTFSASVTVGSVTFKVNGTEGYDSSTQADVVRLSGTADGKAVVGTVRVKYRRVWRWTLSGTWGTTPVSGSGEWHLNLDGSKATRTGTFTGTYKIGG